MTQEPPQAQPPQVVPPSTNPAASSRKALTRSRQHRVVAGVCGGCATYLEIDPVLVRAGFVVLAVFTQGFAVIAYAVLWIVMPEDTTEHAAPTLASASVGASGGGSLVLGVLVIGLGSVWLLGSVTALRIQWGAVASVALIALGVLVAVIGPRPARGGLITLGVLLVVALAVTSAPGMRGVDMRFNGGFLGMPFPGSGFGDRTERPRTLGELQSAYAHGFGSMTVDLRDVELPPGTTRVEASTAFGSTQVFVRPDVPVRVVASTSFGSVEMLGEELGGFGERTKQDASYDGAPRRLELTVSTVFGSAQVRR